MAHVLHSMGWRGLHVVYDLPQMVVLQRYYTRKAGVPTRLLEYDVRAQALGVHTRDARHRLRANVSWREASDDSSRHAPSFSSGDHGGVETGDTRTPAAGRLGRWRGGGRSAPLLTGTQRGAPLDGTLYVSSVHLAHLTTVFANQGGDLSSAAFVGTFSFTEADVGTRDALRAHVSSFGRILLVFFQSWDGVDNVQYLNAWVSGSLNRTHSVCSWAYDRRHSHYLVAVRRDLGVGLVRGASVLGCSRQSLHPVLPNDCEFEA